MMEKDVRGWCIGRDAQGVPTLSECAVVRGAEGRYFAVMIDREGNPLTVRTYQRGETFFESKSEALRAELLALKREYVRYAGMVNRLDRLIRDVVDKLEELEKEEDKSAT